MRQLIINAAAGALLVFGLACGGGGGSNPPAWTATAPKITFSPSDATVNVGKSASFSIAVTGDPYPTVQWYKADGTTISGATSTTYTISTVAKTDDGLQVYAKATNSAGSVTSGKATLHVQWLGITTQPSDQVAQEGSTATFTVVADASPACTYQWKRNGSAINGATGASLDVASATVATDDGAQFTCTMANAAGTLTTSPAAVLCVHAAEGGWPAITTDTTINGQASAATVTTGDQVVFMIAASNSPTSYQWQKDGVNITGATSATYTLPAATLTDGGSYRCRAINASGSSISSFATLSVKTAFAYKGMAYISYNASDYSSNAGANSTALAADSVNWVTILATWKQATLTSTSINMDSYTPTDASVIAAIQAFHSKGIKVMLKPHVDVTSGEWRGSINVTGSANLDAWFTSYTSFITHYATMAKNYGAEGLCIGCELKGMTGSANQARWTSVISAVKAIYSGTLTYAANASSIGDEYTTVSFWDDLDLMGLDGYFRLNNASAVPPDSTVAQLVADWGTESQGIVQSVKGLNGAHSKQVIMTEIGYRSVNGSEWDPWDYSRAGTPDAAEQQNCYEAAFQVWAPRSSWMKGFFWWSWGNASDYSPQGKLAETTLKTWYGAASFIETAQESQSATAKAVAGSEEEPALVAAAKAGQVDVVRQLLASQVNVNVFGKSGRTALMEAARHGDLEMAKVLIQAGANLDRASRGEGSALELAERHGQSQVALLLRQAGARSTGKSVGDTVCVRPWGGQGYCGQVLETDPDGVRICVTRIVGCEEGCPPMEGFSAGRSVGPDGIQVGDVLTVSLSALTHTGVQP